LLILLKWGYAILALKHRKGMNLSMKKVLLSFGTRPEAIKMCPLYLELKKCRDFETICLVTAQHRDMLDNVLKTFGVKPDYDLDIMGQNQTITDITCSVLQKLKPILVSEKPDLVLVHGDTTTAFASALACFYEKIPVGHVEAGMRSFDIYSPFPEEVNRKMISTVAKLNFAATKTAYENLIREGVDENAIYLTGNTVIDALRISKNDNFTFTEKALNSIDFDNKRIILLTCHRRENLGRAMSNIFTSVKRILEDYQDVEFVFPIHKNQAVRDAFNNVGIKNERMHLIEPLDYLPFIYLMEKSYLILTDSGGIQEEAPYFGKPVVVVRDVTERMEAVEAGTVILAGTESDNVYNTVAMLLDNNERYQRMSRAINPYGDGWACNRISQNIKYYFGFSKSPATPFIV
jgi:UDP-N-acetylglucosamine 2-epimerase (non-hydrolysing)